MNDPTILSLLQDADPELGHDPDEEVNEFESERGCDCCGEFFTYTDEIFVLEIAEAIRDVSGKVEWDILRADDYDYQYEPYLFHLSCWEEVLSLIDEMTEDQPPMHAPERALTCSRCESDISSLEPFVASTFGELHVARRHPSGETTDTIERIGSMHPVCLACIAHAVDDERFEGWLELLDMLALPRPNNEDEEEL